MTDDDFGTALHDRVRDEHPDLDQLIRVSTRAGTRLRRRRTTGLALAGAAAAAVAVALVGASLGGSGTTPGGTETGVATQPTPSAKPTTPPDVVQPATPLPQDLPVHVAASLTGWEIGTAADDKIPTSKGDSYITVVVRPKSELAAWSSGDPDHPDNQVAHVGRNYFVTVQPADDVPLAVMDELLAALRYDATWKQ